MNHDHLQNQIDELTHRTERIERLVILLREGHGEHYLNSDTDVFNDTKKLEEQVELDRLSRMDDV